MKIFSIIAIGMLFSALAWGNASVTHHDIAQLKADKAQVLKAELKRLERLTGVSSAEKGLKSECPDVDVDIDIDTDRNGGVSPYCEGRWSDGSCMRYGSDRVGECYPNCEARWSDGSCMRWGADICL